MLDVLCTRLLPNFIQLTCRVLAISLNLQAECKTEDPDQLTDLDLHCYLYSTYLGLVCYVLSNAAVILHVWGKNTVIYQRNKSTNFVYVCYRRPDQSLSVTQGSTTGRRDLQIYT